MEEARVAVGRWRAEFLDEDEQLSPSRAEPRAPRPMAPPGGDEPPPDGE